MARKCIFCGGAPLTREHIWPLWLASELPSDELTTFTFERAGMEPRVWEAPATSTTVRTVCAKCNNGWMSALENRASDLLTPLVRGEAVRLGRPSQHVIAGWALKTAVILDQMNPTLPIPREHLDHLRQHGEPPDNVHVFAAAHAGEGPENTMSRSTILELHLDQFEGGLPREAYVATVAVGQLALQVIGCGIPASQNVAWVHNGRLSASVRRIFPPINRVKWPPGPVLPREGLFALADHWTNG